MNSAPATASRTDIDADGKVAAATAVEHNISNSSFNRLSSESSHQGAASRMLASCKAAWSRLSTDVDGTAADTSRIFASWDIDLLPHMERFLRLLEDYHSKADPDTGLIHASQGDKEALAAAALMVFKGLRADIPKTKPRFVPGRIPAASLDDKATNAEQVANVLDETIAGLERFAVSAAAPRSSDAMPARAPMMVPASPRALSTPAAANSSSADTATQKYADDDLGWLEVVRYSVLNTLGSYPPLTLTARPEAVALPAPSGRALRIAIFGDAGAVGIPQMKRVMSRILEQQPDVVLHLGDIYYSGENQACEEFLSTWERLQDRKSKVPLWCIPGNHEYVSNGQGFLNHLHRFGDVQHQQPQTQTYFSLVNDQFLIIGLDSGLQSRNVMSSIASFLRGHLFHQGSPDDDSTSLDPEQLNWLQKQVQKHKGKKLILLTHHQVISEYWNVDANRGPDFPPFPVSDLANQMRLFVKDPVCWFWGHEHAYGVYAIKDARKYGLPPIGILLGDGAMPCSPPKSGDGRYIKTDNAADITRLNGPPKAWTSKYPPNGFGMLLLTQAGGATFQRFDVDFDSGAASLRDGEFRIA